MATAFMASTAEPTLERPVPSTLAEPGDRGDLTIGAGVVEKIARQAATEVPGVVDVVSRGLARLIGGGGGASAEVVPGARQEQSRAARVELTLTLRYPTPAGQTSRAVRQRVVERVQALTGLRLDRVDITVAALDNEPGRPSSGRVQ
ncbi:MAG: hypothetical protein QOG64_2780 [Acidimicrobiaceae bacterium]|nr:hypothetical protein [Acidimicrobiaceae bacterium]